MKKYIKLFEEFGADDEFPLDSVFHASDKYLNIGPTIIIANWISPQSADEDTIEQSYDTILDIISDATSIISSRIIDDGTDFEIKVPGPLNKKDKEKLLEVIKTYISSTLEDYSGTVFDDYSLTIDGEELIIPGH